VKQETQGRGHQPATTAEHCMFTAAAAVDAAAAAVIRVLRAKTLPCTLLTSTQINVQ
jgi:hypothetical protein